MSTSHFTLRLIHITAIFVNVVWFASRNTFPSGNNCVTLRSGWVNRRASLALLCSESFATAPHCHCCLRSPHYMRVGFTEDVSKLFRKTKHYYDRIMRNLLEECLIQRFRENALLIFLRAEHSRSLQSQTGVHSFK